MTLKMKTTAYGFMALLVASVTLAMTPVATAQGVQPTTTSSSVTELLMPDTGNAEALVTTFVYIPSGASGCVVPIKVEWSMPTIPPGTTVAIQPTSYTFTYSGDAPFTAPQGENYELPIKPKVFFTATRDAVAFKTDTFELITIVTPQGSAQQGCNFTPGETRTDIQVKYDYFGLMQVQPQNFLLKANQNAQIRFPVKVENRGNGPLKVSFTATQQKEGGLDTVIPPTVLYLDTPLKGTTATKEATVIFTAQTPHRNGYTNSFYSINAVFTGSYDGVLPGGSAAKADVQEVVLSVQVQGVYVPGFDPTFAIGALGVALLGIRRLRPE